MKAIVKMAAVAALAMVSMQSNAQSVYDYAPEGGTFTTEVKFNPFATSFNTFGLSGLKGRYFMTDQDAIRLNVDFGIDNSTRTDKVTEDDKFVDENNYTISNTETETLVNNMNLRVALGYERHFLSNGRLDVYAGVEAGYEAIFRRGEITETGNEETKTTNGSNSYTTTTTTYNEYTEYSGMNVDENGKEKYNEHGFFANVFTGIDFYIYKGLYVGTEFGLRFSMGKTMRSGNYTTDYSSKTISMTGNAVDYTYEVKSTTSSEAGTIITTETMIPNGGTSSVNERKEMIPVEDNYNNYTKFEVYIEPALRLGWRF